MYIRMLAVNFRTFKIYLKHSQGTVMTGSKILNASNEKPRCVGCSGLGG